MWSKYCEIKNCAVSVFISLHTTKADCLVNVASI